MKGNPLKVHLDNLGESIGTTYGMLSQLDNHLDDYKNILIKRFESIDDKKNYRLLATNLVIGDLTGNSDKGWKVNFPTNYSFQLRLEEVDQKIDLLIERESMRSIAFCYEMLEKYLYDITARYLFDHKESYVEIVKSKIKPLDQTIDSYFTGIRNLRGKNNKEILSLLRSISNHLSKAESMNNEGINLKDWFEVLSRVRHGIIHSNFRLKKDSKQLFTHSEHDILDRYFPNIQGPIFYELKIKRRHADKILSLILEYGILIFKSLSIEGNYDWRIFKNMDG